MRRIQSLVRSAANWNLSTKKRILLPYVPEDIHQCLFNSDQSHFFVLRKDGITERFTVVDGEEIQAIQRLECPVEARDLLDHQITLSANGKQLFWIARSPYPYGNDKAPIANKTIIAIYEIDKSPNDANR